MSKKCPESAASLAGEGAGAAGEGEVAEVAGARLLVVVARGSGDRVLRSQGITRRMISVRGKVGYQSTCHADVLIIVFLCVVIVVPTKRSRKSAPAKFEVNFSSGESSTSVYVCASVCLFPPTTSCDSLCTDRLRRKRL